MGQFDSVDAAARLPLARVTSVYAENGRGKTTLAAVMRSLATGDPLPISERRRMAAQHPPHEVVDCIGGPPAAIFQNGARSEEHTSELQSLMRILYAVFCLKNTYNNTRIRHTNKQKNY